MHNLRFKSIKPEPPHPMLCVDHFWLWMDELTMHLVMHACHVGLHFENCSFDFNAQLSIFIIFSSSHQKLAIWLELSALYQSANKPCLFLCVRVCVLDCVLVQTCKCKTQQKKLKKVWRGERVQKLGKADEEDHYLLTHSPIHSFNFNLSLWIYAYEKKTCLLSFFYYFTWIIW